MCIRDSYYRTQISSVISCTVWLLGSIFMVSSAWYVWILATLIPPSNIAFCVSAILFQPSPVTYYAQVSSLSSGIFSGYFPSVRISYKYLLSRIISSRISCQSGIGVRAIRMTARIAPTNAAAPMTANNFLLSFFFAALQISAAQATQTAAATSAMPSDSHSHDSSYRILMQSSSPVR